MDLLRIAHITFSSSGGAGSVARSLATNQSELGHEVKLFNVIENNLISSPLTSPMTTTAALIDQFVIAARGESQFSMLRGEISLDGILEDLANFDIVHLHWPAGILSREQIVSLTSTAKVVWTLHDYWSLTGGCHFPGNCGQFTRNCESCPRVHRTFKNYPNSLRKKLQIENIAFIAPSEFAKKFAQTGSNLTGTQITVIPNPVEISTSDNVNHETDRKQSKNSRLTLGFIASNLNDPRKKISETIQILDKPDMSGTQILLAGSGKIRFRTKYVDLRYLGALSGQNLLNFYQSIHALLIPSSNETFSLTTVEAALCGTPVIAPAHSAQAEIIDRFQVGLLYSNSIQLAQLSYWDSLPDLAEHTRQTLREHYKPKSIANKHLDFYRQMLAQPVN